MRSCLHEDPSTEVKVSLTRRPLRGGRKSFAQLEEVRALRLLKMTHIKIGWVSCRVRRMLEASRCYRCLGFGHMAALCRGPDRSRGCWRWGVEGHTAAACTGKPQCYLCAKRKEKPRTDHLPGTTRCAIFREL